MSINITFITKWHTFNIVAIIFAANNEDTVN